MLKSVLSLRQQKSIFENRQNGRIDYNRQLVLPLSRHHILLPVGILLQYNMSIVQIRFQHHRR